MLLSSEKMISLRDLEINSFARECSDEIDQSLITDR